MSKFLAVGTNRCECGVCNERFGGVKAFEVHRVGVQGDRSCMATSVMRERGLTTKVWDDNTVYWTKPYGNPTKTS